MRTVKRRVPVAIAFGDFAKQRGAAELRQLPDYVESFAQAYAVSHGRKRKPAARAKIVYFARNVARRMLRQVIPDYIGRGRLHRPTLPAIRFRYFRETSHTVDDSGLVQVLRSYYAAIRASPGDIVTVRLYEHDVEIMSAAGQMLRRHPRSTKPGHFEIKDSDRIFNPSRETVRLLGRVAKLGPKSLELGRDIFLRVKRF